MYVAIAQFAPSKDLEKNQRVVSELTERAAKGGADLVVFPEEAMLLANGLDEPLETVANREWEGFHTHISLLAKQHQIAIIAAGYEANGDDLPYNTMKFASKAGEDLGSYRKMHLYDAFAYQESSYVMRGNDGPQIVDFESFKIGLLNCYDLRFPEMARLLVEQGADILVVSAAWVAGAMKEDHWRTLLRARAIENTCWVVASSSTSSDCIGQSMVIDPMGVVRGCLGNDETGLQILEITKERIDEVRITLPVLLNRRIMLTKE